MIIKLEIPSTNSHYEIDPDKLSYAEIETMETDLDITWGELGIGLNRFSVKAVKVLLWICMRRENPNVTWNDVEFDPSDFAFVPPETGDEPTPNRAQRRASSRPKAGESS